MLTDISSAFTLRSPRISGHSSLASPYPRPVSISAWLTGFRSVSAANPDQQLSARPGAPTKRQTTPALD